MSRSPDLILLDDVKPEHHNYIWADRVARKEIHFVAGKPDQGKGQLLAKIGADVSWGRDAFTGELGAKSLIEPKQAPLEPMNILYSSMEDGYGTMLRPRLQAQGVRPKSIHLRKFRLPLDFAELADIVIDKQIDLIFFDPLASSMSGGINRFGDQIRSVTDPLKELLEATNSAALFVDHVRKHVGPNSDPLQAVGGASSGFPAACRMGFLFGKDPDDEDRALLANVKYNIRPKAKAMDFEIDQVETTFDWTDPDTGEVEHFEHENVPKLVCRGEDYFSPIKLVMGGSGKGVMGRPADKRAQAVEWLTVYLWQARQRHDGSYPVLGKVVQADALQWGMTYRTLRRAADEMHIVKSGRGGHGVTWSLPDTIIDMLEGELDSVEDQPQVAQPPVEESALTSMLDKGINPSGDDSEWTRHQEQQEPSPTSPEFDAAFESFLTDLNEDDKNQDGGDDAQA